MAALRAAAYTSRQTNLKLGRNVMAKLGAGARALAGRSPVRIDLALQGGGAHGAFTWGVLDRFLEEPWLQIEGISGTSAGAMNAAVMVASHAVGGAPAAQAALTAFWRRVSDSARVSPFQRGPLDILLNRWTLDFSPTFIAMDLASRLLSPYDLNPGGLNPLRDVLAHSVDFTQLAQAPIKLFITATNVRTGRGRVFRNAEVTPDGWPRPACRPCSRPSRSTARPIGTAATRATPRSRPWFANSMPATPSSCRSTRSSARARRASRATFSIG
jgi:NTE family protein